MSRLAALAALARADFLERVRRPSFLLTLGAAAWLGYLVASGRVTLQVGGRRGVLDSAWIGALTALSIGTFLTLAGFYLVRGAVGRDRRTGVGEILATTPISRPLYCLGKALSGFAVLAAMAGVLGLAAVAMQLTRGEAGGVDLVALWGPIALLSLPALAAVAALAVLFDTTPGLRGAAGNVLYLVLWAMTLVAPFTLGRFDLAGLRPVRASMMAAARAQVPGIGEGFVLGVVADQDVAAGPAYRWDGLGWTPELVAGRLGWLAAALALALVAAVPFDRFDPARGAGRAVRRRRGRSPDGPSTGDTAAAPVPTPMRGPDLAPATPPEARLTPLAAAPGRPSPARLVAAELRLLLAGRNRWWALAALGLAAAGWLLPLTAARQALLPVAWLWPLPLFSSLGARDRLYATAPLVDCCPRPVARQVPAAWAAGALLALAMGSGVLVRLALAGDLGHLAAGLAGAAFVPAAALAAGTWSGGTTLFEAGYLALWYVGPFNRTPALDFIGTTDAGGRPAVWLAAAALLLAAAGLGRRRRLHAD